MALDEDVKNEEQGFWRRAKRTLKRPLQITSLAALMGLATLEGYSQKAELDLTLTRPDAQPATGIVRITGDTLINDGDFPGSKTYILKNITGIDDRISNEKHLTYGPNPVDGFLHINLKRPQGTIEAYAVDGKLLGKADLSSDDHMRIDAAPGVVLLRYTGKDGEREIIKLVNNARTIEASISLATQPTRTTLKSAASDIYNVQYTDPTGNLEGKEWHLDIPTGTTYTIDEAIDWSEKTVSWEAATNTGTTITATGLKDQEELDRATSADGNFSERSFTRRFNNEEGLEIAYELAAPYTDTARYVIRQYMNEKFIMDTLRNGHFHLTITGNGDEYTVRNDGEPVSGANVGEASSFKLPGDLAFLEIIVTGEGLKTDTAHITMDKGERTEDVQLDELTPETYNYRFFSDESSPDGASMEAWEDRNRIATATVNDSSYTSSDWTSTLTNMSIDSVLFTAPGHVKLKYTDVHVTTGSNKLDANLEEEPPEEQHYRFTSSSSSPDGTAMRAWENGQEITSATVSNGSYTSSDWTSTLTNMSIDSVRFTNDGYVAKRFFNVPVMPGNNVLDANLEEEQPETHEYWLTSSSSSPGGATVKGWKDGTAILNSTVSGNSYETNRVERTSATLTLDSIVVDATGHIKEVTLNYAMTPGGTRHDFSLEEEAQEHTYDISGRGHLIGAIISGLPNEAIDYLNGGDIRFTTKRDMQTHDIGIDSNGNFDGDITGNYSPSDTILIDFINNPNATSNTFSLLDGSYVASVGKIQNDDGSYAAGLGRTGFVQYDAWTTLEKLDGKNLVFVAFSDNAYSNDDAIDMIRGQGNNGVISYIEPDVTFYNDTINHSTLTPISAENRQDQNDAIDFLIGQLTTRTGLTLVNTSKAYCDNNWTQPRGASYVFRSNLNPSNSVVGVGGLTNTFYMSDANTRTSNGINMVISEISEGQGRVLDIEIPSGDYSNEEGFIYHPTSGEITDLSWIGDVANKTAYLFPAGFFEKE